MRRKALPDVPAEGFHFDADSHLYFYDGKPMMGCTTVLGVLAKPALIPWAAKMATTYIADAAPKLGNGNYEVSSALLEEAKNAHRKKKEDAAEKGTDLHALVEDWIKWVIARADGDPSEVLPHPVHDEKIQPFVEWARKEKVRFVATEQRLYSKSLWVAGTCDFIFEKDGKRYIGDIKTYKKIWDRVPLIQCAGYALMWEEMNTPTRTDTAGGVAITSRGPTPHIDGYVVVCLPKERAFNEEEDVLWSVDTEGDTEAFRAVVRLHKYLNQK